MGSAERGEQTTADAVLEPLAGFGSGESTAEAERREEVVRIRRVLAIATAAWAGSAPVDALLVHWVGQGRLGAILGVRAVSTLALLAVLLRHHVDPLPAPPLLRRLHLFALATAGASMALMAVELGSLASAYAHGVSVALVAYGVAFQEPWRRGAVFAGVTVLGYFGVLLAALPLSPTLAASFAEGAVRAALLQHGLLVSLTAALVVAGGHRAHRMRRQASSARGLGRYELRERIAQGGMGEIWRAHHAALDREVAVKIVRPDRSSPAANARFKREVRALAELRHPSIVRIFDHGVTTEGARFYAMELLEGETLDTRLLGGKKMNPTRAAELVRDVARALAEAHVRGIVHRDVTPRNLFLVALPTGEELVKVLDFGIAKPQEGADETSTLTAHGTVVGTPAYMAPEQAQGAQVDARTDLYALGAVLFRMLCGCPPFEKASKAETLQAHVWDAPPKPSWIADVPAELEAIVLRCLRKAPAERFTTATELADALAAFLRAPAAVAAPPPTAAPAPETIDASVDALAGDGGRGGRDVDA